MSKAGDHGSSFTNSDMAHPLGPAELSSDRRGIAYVGLRVIGGDVCPASREIRSFSHPPCHVVTISTVSQDECGEWVTALCPYGESGCPDNEGDYDIVMPEPMMGTSGSNYKVRVMDVADESSMDCSDAFTLLASTEASTDADDYSLTVTSPAAGDMAYAGEEYTVEVSISSWRHHF